MLKPAASGRFAELESLRCFAMTGVVAQHAGILPIGWMGVWLFFVLSGVVVTMSVSRVRDTRSQGETLMAFYRKRAARIFPIYFLFLLVGVLWTWVQGANVEVAPLLSLVFFYNNFAMAQGFGELSHWNVGHLWSISVEMQFYALFGIALVACPRRVLNVILVAVIALCPLLRLIAGMVLSGNGVAADAAAYTIYSFSLLHFDAFAMGSLVALNLEALCKGNRPFYVLGCAVALFGLYAGGIVLENANVVGAHGLDLMRNVISGTLFGGWRHVMVYTVLNLLAAALILLVLSIRAPLLNRALSMPPLVFIGARSYGAYVVHTVALAAAWSILTTLHPDPAPGFLYGVGVFALTYAITIAVASASFIWIERPAQRWIIQTGASPVPDLARP